MMNKRLLITGFCCCMALWSLAQTALLDKRVSFSYQQVSLEYALTDISKSHQLNFSYSRDYLPLKQRISAKARNIKLAEGLDQLLGQTQVVYAVIGDQVVLRVDKSKKVIKPLQPVEDALGSNQRKHRTNSAPEPEVLTADNGSMKTGEGSKPEWLNTEPLDKPEAVTIDHDDESPAEIDQELEEMPTELRNRNLKKHRNRIAQISILPYVGTNMDRSAGITNNLSINVLWGRNGGVEGVEIGGLVNSVKNDVIGVQVAGLGNSVGQMVHGTQVAGLFNYSGAYTTGVQAAGLFNFARSGNIVQTAGLLNFSEGDFNGVQLAGLGNSVGGDAEAVQIAGLYNTSKGRTKLQIAGLFNIAGDVEHGQISSIINIGKRVNGNQIGLINVSDTISGVPFGLLNLVKNGYNRVEFSAGDVLHANLALKLGARSFYNIFHLGLRIDNELSDNPQRDGKYSWGYGYGIGTATAVGRNTLMNFELLSIQVNERETFTNKLNLLNQLKVTADFKIRGKFSLFLGPSINVLVSKLYNPDTQQYGSTIPTYDLYNETNGKANTRIWLGGNVGVRF